MGLGTRVAHFFGFGDVAAKGLDFIPADAHLGSGGLPRTFYHYGRDVGQGFDSTSSWPRSCGSCGPSPRRTR